MFPASILAAPTGATRPSGADVASVDKRLDFLDDYPCPLNLNDLHAAPWCDVVAFSHNVEKPLAELGFAGRTQRSHRDADRAEQVHGPAVRQRHRRDVFAFLVGSIALTWSLPSIPILNK